MDRGDRRFLPLILMGLLTLGVVDFMTHESMEFFVFYFPLIAMSVWTARSRSPYLLVTGASCLFWLLDAAHSHHAWPFWLRGWNALVHCGAYLSVMIVMLKFRERHDAVMEIERELQKLLEREKLLSRFDPLTGALNVRALHERIDHERSRHNRYQSAFSVLFLDVDRFKELNDALGHAAGDDVLKRLVKMLKKCTRDVDSVARMGGDEFVVLLPETDGEGARLCAEKILSALKTDFELPVDVSIGISTFEGQFPSNKLLLHSADEAMYRAKKSGHSRIAVGE